MALRILEGRKIYEGDEDGAVFYDSTTGLAFGPVFDNAEEAENFVSFLAGMDPRVLQDWDSVAAVAQELYKKWLECGKLPKRPVVQLDKTYLVAGDSKKKREFNGDLREVCFPLFNGYNNYQIEDILRKAGVLGDCETDSEHSCFYATFKDEAKALAFLERLNGWLRDNWHRAYPECTWGRWKLIFRKTSS